MARKPPSAARTGRNELARDAHFRKAGPTEKTGREKIKEQRRRDRAEEREAVTECSEVDTSQE